MHSSTVKIRKRHIIRAGDMFYMNTSSKESCCLNPCISCKAAAAAGRPVNPIYGLKFLESETDFAFEGHPAALTGSSGRFGRRLHHLPAGGGGRHQRQPTVPTSGRERPTSSMTNWAGSPKRAANCSSLTCAQYLFRGTSRIKPDSFGTAATYCRKFTQTADIPT